MTTRGRLIRKQARSTVKILEGARRAHVELGVLPTGAGDYVDDAARVDKVRIKHCDIGVDNLLGNKINFNKVSRLVKLKFIETHYLTGLFYGYCSPLNFHGQHKVPLFKILKSEYYANIQR